MNAAEKKMKKVDLDQLLNSPLAENLKDAGQLLKKVLEDPDKAKSAAKDIYDSEDEVGMVMLISVVEKMCHGKDPKNFSKDDWKEIAGNINGAVVEGDGSGYSAFIFGKYADYIDASISRLDLIGIADKSKEKKQAIHALAEEIRSDTDDLRSGKITEPDYVEKCMWTSLEAMIRLLAAAISIPKFKELNDLKNSVAEFAFCYARFTLAHQEQELLEEYEMHRHLVDEDLKQQYDEYQKKLQELSDQFYSLMDDAFEGDFRSRLEGSVRLAREAGVEESEILHSTEEVDDFFM